MAIIKQKNKKTGIIYVYESHSYRDKVTKQHKSTRKLIGRYDESTGKVIPTRKQNRKNITTCSESLTIQTTDELHSVEAASFDIIRRKNSEIMELKKQNDLLMQERNQLADKLEKLAASLRT